MNLRIGNMILRLRKEHNMTQSKLASILNVSDKAVSKWETNIAYPGIDQLVKISELFHISVDVLLGLKEYSKEDINANSYLDELSEKFNLPLDEFQTFVQELPCTLFFKDINLKYQLISNPWKEFLIDEDTLSIIGKDDFEVFSDLELAKLYNNDDLEIISTGKWSYLYGEHPREDGTIRYSQIIKKPIYNKSGKIIGIIGIVNDITEMKALHKHTGMALITDQITGAYTKSYYEQFLATGITPQQIPFSFIRFNLKNLEEINNLYGNLKANHLLIQNINLIKYNIPEEYPIIRMSYDEFLILCPNYSSEKSKNLISVLNENQKNLTDSNLLLTISFSFSTIHTIAEMLENIIKNSYQ